MSGSHQQNRASLAAQLVAGVPKDAQKRYNSLVNSLPMMIRTNGLLHVVAFLMAKANSGAAGAERSVAEAIVLDHVTRHLEYLTKRKTEERLVDVLTRLEYPVYMRVQEEAVDCLSWHRRFGRALFGEPEDNA